MTLEPGYRPIADDVLALHIAKAETPGTEERSATPAERVATTASGGPGGRRAATGRVAEEPVATMSQSPPATPPVRVYRTARGLPRAAVSLAYLAGGPKARTPESVYVVTRRAIELLGGMASFASFGRPWWARTR
jgi:hypothetical protein